MSSPSSGSKKKPSKKLEALLANSFHIDFLFGIFSDPEDGGDMFFRNVN
jgi:hypothetical protein